MRVVIILLLALLSTQNKVYAGRLAQKAAIALEEEEASTAEKAFSKLKYQAKGAAKFLPDGGITTAILERLDGGGVEEKVDRIEKRQKTALDRIRDIARKALDTKNKVEEMYYYKKRSQEQAQFLAEGLKRGNKKKFLGALIEEGLKIPINPAEYIPQTDQTSKLKEQLELDLSFEQGIVRQGQYLVSDTRAALMATNLLHTHPKQFEQAYKQAEAYESTLSDALQAKEVATVKIYKAEIERLEKELQLLEQVKRKPGLTVGDVMQIEMTIDNKRWHIRELNEKITASIKADLLLSEEQKQVLATHRAHQQATDLAEHLASEKRRIYQQHAHLWNL